MKDKIPLCEICENPACGKHKKFLCEYDCPECFNESENGKVWEKKSKIIETAERIVIDYANLSGRETANRAEFRQRVIKHLEDLLKPKD